MNDPTLYAKSNPFQIRDAKLILKSLHSSVTDTNETDSILDIGCGVGNVTSNVLMPMFQDYHRIVGIDVSPGMIQYARQNNTFSKISYEVLNIAGDVENFKNNWGCFSKVFSFYCLHWIKDHKTTLRNISRLLSTGGDCLLVFVAQCPVFELYEKMAESPKWKQFMEDVQDFVPNTQHCVQPVYDFSCLMEDSGLRVLNCEMLNMEYTFNSIEILKDCFCAVCPFVNRIPKEDRQKYVTDCLRVLSSLSSHERDANANEGFGFRYRLMVAHARKSL